MGFPGPNLVFFSIALHGTNASVDAISEPKLERHECAKYCRYSAKTSREWEYFTLLFQFFSYFISLFSVENEA